MSGRCFLPIFGPPSTRPEFTLSQTYWLCASVAPSGPETTPTEWLRLNIHITAFFILFQYVNIKPISTGDSASTNSNWICLQFILHQSLFTYMVYNIHIYMLFKSKGNTVLICSGSRKIVPKHAINWLLKIRIKLIRWNQFDEKQESYAQIYGHVTLKFTVVRTYGMVTYPAGLTTEPARWSRDQYMFAESPHGGKFWWRH